MYLEAEADFDIAGPGGPLTSTGPLCRGGFKMVCLAELCGPLKRAGPGARAPVHPLNPPLGNMRTYNRPLPRFWYTQNLEYLRDFYFVFNLT